MKESSRDKSKYSKKPLKNRSEDAMLLAIDVGNTHTVLGVFSGENLLVDWRIATDRKATEDELGVLLRNLFAAEGLTFDQIKGICIVADV